MRHGQHTFTIGNQLITERPAPTRERILDAAVDLFGRRGFSATSVGDIERAAGLTPRAGALYKHFPSKVALLEAAVERRSRAVDELEPLVAAAGRAEGGLPMLARLAFIEIGRDQDVLRIVMREGENFPELRDRFYDRIVRRGHEQTVELLRRLAGPGPREIDMEALAAVLLGSLINYHVLGTLFGRPAAGVTEERFLEAWADSCTRLLESHGLLHRAPTPEVSA